MRVLLDEHLPVRLARSCAEHDVSTVRAQGWSVTKNGALLRLAADAGFEVLVTNDRSIEFQQNFDELRLALVVLNAPTNKLEDLLPLVPSIIEALPSVVSGEVRHIAG